ncbi:MAG TPA: TrkH family potassium uptake protein [Spongiibacteraceae bacterium]|jgi:trk system potassium uptake protein TrkH|nr:TrkH family potassium uptake protein [Spongiibacteraceae bacterium]HUH36972.1 TrkH family potassium uptake protein [Spongiibacteraceae bacterium]
MHYAIILRILGILLMIFSLTMLLPAMVALYYGDSGLVPFLIAFAITLLTGAVLWTPVNRRQQELRTRDGFLITSLFWIVLSLFGALPFILAEQPNLSVSDAVFESVSGLTTTGATVLTGLDELPHSVLFYRQLLQWLGGIGIIVIAVAILPLLGVGGMQLYRTELPGPVKDTKLTPRITGTAKALFLIYLGLTLACALGYRIAGMSNFDALCHAFSTVAIGGFSTHDASIGHFNSPAVTLICTVFMFLAGINFALHFFAWRGKRIDHYLRDPETRFYAGVIGSAALLVCLYLILSGFYATEEGLLQGVFQTVSIATTTGFTTANFALWPSFLPMLLILLSFMGGCASSAGGGMKAVRVMLIAKQGIRELTQLVHPNAVIPLKVGNRRVEAKVVSAVWSFFAVYMFAFLFIMLLLMATGLDQYTAFSAVAATLNNLGPGLGAVAAHYGDINAVAKWLLSFAMLLGRLEVFTLLVLFTPAFWRQ